MTEYHNMIFKVRNNIDLSLLIMQCQLSNLEMVKTQNINMLFC